jgi:hypothetical protein
MRRIAPAGHRGPELQQFHVDEPCLKQPSRLRSARQAQACSTERLAITRRSRGVTGRKFTDGVTNAEPEEMIMLRKLSLVAVAAASLGAAALAPTSASAWGGHGWHHGGWHHGGWGFGGPRVFIGGPSYGYGGCYARRLVPTPWGPRWRLVNRCY